MNILFTILYIILGIIFLYKGSEWLVGSSERLARYLKVSRSVVGLTIIAIGTSLPEFVTSLTATVSGSSDVALGNVIGSNMANIGLVLGLAIIIKPFRIELKELLRDGPWLILGTVLLLIMAIDGKFSRIDGVILTVFAVIFFYSIVKRVRGTRLAEKDLPWQDEFHLKAKDRVHNIILIIIGIIVLVGGAVLLVKGAVEMAVLLNLPELLVGLTIVAIGTSLPEIAVTSWSSSHGQSQIALGNVIGSNISNIFIILGLVSIISPIQVSPKAIAFDIPIMVLLTLLALFFMKTKESVSRWEGFILLIFYVSYIVWTFLI